MIAGALCVSLGSAFIKMAGHRLPVMEVVFARSLFMLFYCYLLARKDGADIFGHDKRFLFLRGILGFGAYVCIFYAVVHLPLADALVIVYAFPLIVPFMAFIFLKERLERIVLICTAFGATGMFLIAKPSFLFGSGTEMALVPVCIAIGGALFSSVSVLCIRKLTTTEHPLVIVLYAAGISTVGTVLLDGWNWIVPTFVELVILLCVGVLMSMGQHFITVAFSRSSAGRTSVLFYLQVMFGAFLGYVFFDEIPDLATFLGSVFILGSATLLGVQKRRGSSLN